VPPVVVVETAEEGFELFVTTAVCAVALIGKKETKKPKAICVDGLAKEENRRADK